MDLTCQAILSTTRNTQLVPRSLYPWGNPKGLVLIYYEFNPVANAAF